MEEKKEKQGERDRVSTIIERDEESVEKASFEGRRKPSTVRSRVRSIVFCSVKRRNVDRARFLLEGENERRRIFLSALSSPFPRGDEGREEERESGASTRRQRERTSRAEFLLGRLLLREPGSGNRLLACQLDIYTTVSPG